MEPIRDYENECERYLLGSMSEQEQTQLEEQYFENDALFERFLAVKDELVDAYARGQLNPQKRQAFEQHFLATEPRRQKAEEARQFINAVTAVSGASPNVAPAQTTAPAISWWRSISDRIGLPQVALQGAFVLLITGALIGGWLWFRDFENRREEHGRALNQGSQRANQPSEQPSVALAPRKVDDKPANLGGNENATASPSPNANRQTAPPPPAQIATITLTPFAPRGAGAANTLRIDSDTRAARLRITFQGDEYRSYSLSLRTLEGRQILQRRGLKARPGAGEKSLSLNVDPALLTSQDYIATLDGVTRSGETDTVAEYYFRVERTTPR